MARGRAELERSHGDALKRVGAAVGDQLAQVADPLGVAGAMALSWVLFLAFMSGDSILNRLLLSLVIAGSLVASVLEPRVARMGRVVWAGAWQVVKYLLRRMFSEPKALVPRARSGDVAWTWVEYDGGSDADGNVGKDRPVAVIAQSGSKVYVVALTSKDHTYRDDCVAIGSGSWDKSRRPSFAKVDKLYQRDRAALRRVVPRALNGQQLTRIRDGVNRHFEAEQLHDLKAAFRSTIDDDGVGPKIQNVIGWFLIGLWTLTGVISPIIELVRAELVGL